MELGDLKNVKEDFEKQIENLKNMILVNGD